MRDYVEALEHVLKQRSQSLSTARIRPSAARSRPLWRRTGVLTVAAVVSLAGVAVAATQIMSLDEGSTAYGRYEITRAPDQGSMVCMNLRYKGHQPSYGCDVAPSRERPFGLVIADSGSSPSERLIYGLVSDDARRVTALTNDGARVDAPAELRDDLPGRFFSMVVPNNGGVELVAYDAADRHMAHLGDRDPNEAGVQPGRPTTRDELRQRGEPLGYAPSVAMPDRFSYRGGTIARDDAARRGLSCTQDIDGVRCTDGQDRGSDQTDPRARRDDP